MSKVCRNCNLTWKDSDAIRFCPECGQAVETIYDGPSQEQSRQNQQYGGQSQQYGNSRNQQYGGQGQQYSNNQNQQYGNQQQTYGGYNQYTGREIPKDSILESYKKYWKNYVVFRGRTRRADYWQVILVNLIISVALSILGEIPALSGCMNVLSNLFTIVNIIPGLALGVRRLHDIGKSGWWYLICLIPVVGWIIMIVWFVRESEPGDNRYGKNPKWDYSQV